jgi:hypothetical protein
MLVLSEHLISLLPGEDTEFGSTKEEHPNVRATGNAAERGDAGRSVSRDMWARFLLADQRTDVGKVPAPSHARRNGVLERGFGTPIV